MGVIVQKYGGSSVASPEKIKSVAQRIVDTRRQGHQVVVVVSAMGNTTNELLDLASSITANPPRRELDMLVTVGERISMSLLSMAIQDLGCPAVSFTGSQSGIITTDNHADARIIKVTPTRIQDALAREQIVIVAGFQGVSERLEITSLGRGGSDTTAVALAAALDADYAEICSDVDGVYSADPRSVENTQRIEEMSHEEMQSLADAGAKVLNAEAVEWARRQGIEIRCASTHGPRRAGTRIHQGSGLEQQRVTAISAHPGFFYLSGQNNRSRAPEDLESTIAAHGASDARVHRGMNDWWALVPRQNIHGETAFLEAVSAIGDVEIREDLAMVTIVGRALTAAPAVLPIAKMALARGEISVMSQTVDPARVEFITKNEDAMEAVRRLHETLIAGEDTAS